MNWNQKLMKMLKRKALTKIAPTSSQVHVPATGEEDKIVIKSSNGTVVEISKGMAHLTNATELQKLEAELLDSFNRYRTLVAKAAQGPRRVATVALQHDNKLLMGKRRDNGKWTTPGGHLDDGEEFPAGALREVLEETGIQLKDTDLEPISEISKMKDKEGKDLHVQPFKATLKSKPSTSMMGDPDGEVERWRWIDTSKGLPKEVRNNLHVPMEYNLLLKGLGLHEMSRPSDFDQSADVYPQLDNLEAEVLKAVLDDEETDTEDSNNLDEMYGMQRLVEGMDWELEHSTADPNMAKDIAQSHLEDDADYYRKLEMEEDRTDDVLQKDTLQTEEDPYAGEGFNLDLGSGPARQPGHLGLDLYPHDHGTIVHDLNMGIPFPDGSASNVRLCNVEGLEDQKALLSEVHRVLMPGGSFTYEGLDDIYSYPNWESDYPGLVMTNHEDSGIQKADDGCTVYRQTFTRAAVPDPATANDAEPRLGVRAADELPADALIAMDALGYYYSDATSSGKGNRAHGYASQGALDNEVEKDGCSSATMSTGPAKILRFKRVNKDQMASTEDGGNQAAIPSHADGDPVAEEVHRYLNPTNPNPPPPKKLAYAVSKMEKILKSERVVPIMKMNGAKQIVYGVVLAPNEVDAQEDFMEPEEIEKAAHSYLSKSRIVGSGHSEPIEAHPVESFIAPADFEMNGQNGPQVVKKGSWVLGVKVLDPKHWKKIVDGDYTGFSVGGFGLRQET